MTVTVDVAGRGVDNRWGLLATVVLFVVDRRPHHLRIAQRHRTSRDIDRCRTVGKIGWQEIVKVAV